VRLRVGIGIAVVAVAAVVRLWGITTPVNEVWDEHYYAFDAYAYLGGTADLGQPGDPVKIDNEKTWEHPPLGKLLIAAGVGPLGLTSLGERLPPALFGVAGVALVYLLGLLLWGSPWWAGLAALLLALDGMHIVHSRLAMLDVFESTFILAGVLLLVLDRRRDGSTRALAGAGAALGAAVACKWSGLFVLGPALLVVAAWRWRTAGRRQRRPARELALVGACLVALPLAVYVASYGQFFAEHGPAVRAFVTLQHRMLLKQRTNQRLNPERSQPASWPLLTHPIRYYPSRHQARGHREILTLGNPALWWGFLGLGPLLAVMVAVRRRWQDAVPLAGYLAMYLPWFVIGRVKYLYYMVPCVPFMCLAAVAALRHLPARGRRPVAVGFGALVVAAGVAFMPLWTATPLPGWTRHLRWLSSWT
jgi:dolichyl-phosphate-mannose-protein mannosyltransferase